MTCEIKTEVNMRFNSERGQSIMEYIILTSLISLVCIMAIKNLGGVVQRRINVIKEEIVRLIPNK